MRVHSLWCGQTWHCPEQRTGLRKGRLGRPFLPSSGRRRDPQRLFRSDRLVSTNPGQSYGDFLIRTVSASHW